MRKIALWAMFALLLVNLVFNLRVAGCLVSPQTEWSRIYDATDNERAYSVVQTVDRDGSWLVKPAAPTIAATFDFEHNELNLGDRDQFITAYIELPDGYDVAEINVSQTMLNDTIPVCSFAPVSIGDYDSDKIQDLMVKFCRSRIVLPILRNINRTKLLEGESVPITFILAGYLKSGTPFQGSDTIKVMDDSWLSNFVDENSSNGDPEDLDPPPQVLFIETPLGLATIIVAISAMMVIVTIALKKIVVPKFKSRT